MSGLKMVNMPMVRNDGISVRTIYNRRFMP
jgi:hypothetical protein